MKKYSYPIALGLILLAIVVVNFRDQIAGLFKKKPGVGNTGNTTTSGGTSGHSTGTGVTGLNKDLLLSLGSYGPEVSQLQTMLNLLSPGQTPLDVDGDFGGQTESRLLSVTGYASITLNQLIAQQNISLIPLFG